MEAVKIRAIDVFRMRVVEHIQLGTKVQLRQIRSRITLGGLVRKPAKYKMKPRSKRQLILSLFRYLL